MGLKIVSIADKYPEFIKYQYHSIKKYLSPDVDYLVFNNAVNPIIRESINNICKNNNINAINIFLKYDSQGSINHAGALNKIWQEYLSKMNEPILLIDGDIFFINNLNLQEISENYDYGYSPIYRDGGKIETMWSGMFFFNLPKIEKDIDFSITAINGIKTDTSGMTYYYIKKHFDYRKILFRVPAIYSFDNGYLKTEMNNSTGYIEFFNNLPIKEYCEGKLFPHEKENPYYMNAYLKEFSEHMDIIKKYNFPSPYNFDLVKIEGQEKSFAFHYKSASWGKIYGDGNNEYSVLKKRALEKLLAYN